MYSAEMKVKPARRFPSVERVSIACFLTANDLQRDDDTGYYQEDIHDGSPHHFIDFSVTSLAVPFVASFLSIKFVRLGMMKRWRDQGRDAHVFRCWYACDEIDWDQGMEGYMESRALMDSLENSFCGAYESGLIPPDVKVRGCSVGCLKDTSLSCAQCNRHAKCFPPSEVYFAGRLSCPGRLSCLQQRHSAAIVSERRDGRNFFESKEFLFGLCICPPSSVEFAEVVEEIGITLARISRQEFLDWLSKRHYLRRHLEGLHLKRLLSFGVPINATDYMSYEDLRRARMV